jgi:hypothetical protein
MNPIFRSSLAVGMMSFVGWGAVVCHARSVEFRSCAQAPEVKLEKVSGDPDRVATLLGGKLRFFQVEAARESFIEPDQFHLVVTAPVEGSETARACWVSREKFVEFKLGRDFESRAETAISHSRILVPGSASIAERNWDGDYEITADQYQLQVFTGLTGEVLGVDLQLGTVSWEISEFYGIYELQVAHGAPESLRGHTDFQLEISPTGVTRFSVKPARGTLPGKTCVGPTQFVNGTLSVQAVCEGGTKSNFSFEFSRKPRVGVPSYGLLSSPYDADLTDTTSQAMVVIRQ